MILIANPPLRQAIQINAHCEQAPVLMCVVWSNQVSKPQSPNNVNTDHVPVKDKPDILPTSHKSIEI